MDDMRIEESQSLDIDTFLPYQLVVLADTVSRALSHLYADQFGIAIPEWRVLAALGRMGTMTARDIGTLTHMHKTKVSRAISSLENLAMVYRTPNENDLRESFVTLTERGAATYRKIVPQARDFSQALYTSLDNQQQEMLGGILRTLQDAATKLPEAVTFADKTPAAFHDVAS